VSQVAVTQTAASAAGFAVELHGAGQVGGALLPLLRANGIPVAAIHRRRGSERHAVDARRTVLVDATPPCYHGPDAAAWTDQLAQVLAAGSDVVTCNKAPLATAWAKLRQAARQGGGRLLATATVGGGTPVLPTLRAFQRHAPVQSIEATLSGTLGVVLARVKRGATLADATRQAQAARLCEPDPSLDLDGTDAWAKACILHNALWPEERPLGLADRAAPLSLREDEVRALHAPAVVALIRSGSVDVGLRDWPHLGGLAVHASSTAGTLNLSGPGAGPAATAAALLADLQALAAGAPGIL